MNYDKSSRHTNDSPVTPTIEHAGQKAVKENKVKNTLAQKPGKLSEKKCGYKKTNFTPAKSGGSHGSSKGDMTY